MNITDNAYTPYDKILVFENKVLEGLKSCGFDFPEPSGLIKGRGIEDFYSKAGRLNIGAAVSGGADSISLLYSLASILNSCNGGVLHVITVNHFIRPEKETCGDADFVVNCCKSLKDAGFNVECAVIELKPGEVAEMAKTRKAGIEEAARFLRYGAFEKFINDNSLDCLCLAHNKNDNMETVLMRFLQGSNVNGAGGINNIRGKIIRPLLNITRDEIEEYLTARNLSWCNDKTNNDTNYYRNNVRHNLVPVLDKYFHGWDKSVMAGAGKAREDSEIINNIVDRFPVEIEYGNNEKKWSFGEIDNIGKGADEIIGIIFNKADFLNAFTGIQKRLIIKSFNMLGENARISSVFLSDVITSIKNCNDKCFSKLYGSSIEIFVKKNTVFIKKYMKKDTDLIFFDIIERDGIYNFPFGELSVTFNNPGVFVSVNGFEALLQCEYPLCVHNALQGDEIKCGNGKMKKVSDVLSDWHVTDYNKNLIPVISGIQKNDNNIHCILGAFLGYKDWIVK